jgi:hypothetical protein
MHFKALKTFCIKIIGQVVYGFVPVISPSLILGAGRKFSMQEESRERMST